MALPFYDCSTVLAGHCAKKLAQSSFSEFLLLVDAISALPSYMAHSSFDEAMCSSKRIE